LYQKVVQDIYSLWTPEMQKSVARHNNGWATSMFDFEQYFRLSSHRYYTAYQDIYGDNGQRVCDVGGFWGIFPVTLERAGFNVSMTESLEYYDHAFDDLFKYIRSQHVKIIDFDPFQSQNSLLEKFDAITIMAVLEHYPHSLNVFMKNIVSMLKPEGRIYIEVPNIAFWKKRIDLLLGRSPLVPLEVIYRSKVPFTGHHHEFVKSELDFLVNQSGLRINKEHFYNYSLQVSLKDIIQNPMNFFVNILFKDTREVMSVLCCLTPKSG
jgi:2-polyprenyl-3-methyl-5-hydroxy-6-metoxy-1,4-benzoquinol methylase